MTTLTAEPRGNSGGGGASLNPFIQGLLDTLPKPGTEWPTNQRAKWLQTAASIFELIYPGDCGIEVLVAHAELHRAGMDTQAEGSQESTASAEDKERCPNALLPDGPICPRCGERRGPSGVDGGSWVHWPEPQP